MNNPFHIQTVINLMHNSIYEKHLTRDLLRSVVIRERDSTSETEWKVYQTMLTKYNLDLEKLKRIKTWRELDRDFTPKVYTEFTSPTHYYEAASCVNYLSGISVPTLVIHSRDDPIVPVDLVPIDKCASNDNLICAITPRGSHVCYFMSDGRNRWFTHASSEFLRSALELNETKVSNLN